MKFEGVVWRHIPPGAHSLHIGYILKAAGRWNRPGIYGCLYTGLTVDGVRAEYAKYLEVARIPIDAYPHREIVSIKADLDPVIDMISNDTSLVDPEEPFLKGNSPEDFERCRALADIARSLGYVGLLVPSAALEGATNLVIYIDGLAARVQLEVGNDRFPL